MWNDMNKDIACLFEWFAQESTNIATQANEPQRREGLANLALLWRIAAAEHRGRNKQPVKQSLGVGTANSQP
jgi:hypothetical protein